MQYNTDLRNPLILLFQPEQQQNLETLKIPFLGWSMIEGAKNLSQLERLTKKLVLMLFGFQVVASILTTRE